MLEALLLIPLLSSALLFAWKNPSAKYVALILSFAEMAVTFYILSDFNYHTLIGAGKSQYEIDFAWSHSIRSRIHFGIDGMTLLFLLLTNILTPLIILSSFNQKVNYSNTFYALILLMQFGLVGVFSSFDGLLFYAFWEITLIPIWFICGLWGQEDQKLKFTTRFFVFTFVGSLFMLAGFVYVYNHAPSFEWTDMYKADLKPNYEILVFWFIFIAFAVKLPIFPFHTWQPDTYTYAPTQGSMLLSGIMLKMAVFGILRFLLPITPVALLGMSGKIVLTFAIIGIVYGALIAIVKNDIKRIIAYSSLSHVGLITAGIFASAMVTVKGHFTFEGAQGALVQSFAHGINVVGLFYCADILYKNFQTRNIKEMGGLAKVAPKFAILFFIILLGSMAVPLSNGFVGEFILLKSLAEFDIVFNGYTLFAGGLTVILCAVYMLRMYGKTMFGKGNEAVLAKARDISDVEFSVLASLAVFVIMLGIFPESILQLVNTSLKFIYQSIIS